MEESFFGFAGFAAGGGLALLESNVGPYVTNPPRARAERLTSGGRMRYMIISGHDYTLYVDYDRGHFGRLAGVADKVSYMSARVERDLLQPCRLALRFQESVAVGLLVPGLVCSGISAAASFLYGRQAGGGEDGTFFKAFVRRFMRHDLQAVLAHPADRRVNDYADWLYHYVRCGLSHSFALIWGHIEGRNSMTAYVDLDPATHQPRINQDRLLDDFAQGWNNYLLEVDGTVFRSRGGDQIANLVSRSGGGQLARAEWWQGTSRGDFRGQGTGSKTCFKRKKRRSGRGG